MKVYNLFGTKRGNVAAFTLSQAQDGAGRTRVVLSARWYKPPTAEDSRQFDEFMEETIQGRRVFGPIPVMTDEEREARTQHFLKTGRKLDEKPN